MEVNQPSRHQNFYQLWCLVCIVLLCANKMKQQNLLHNTITIGPLQIQENGVTKVIGVVSYGTGCASRYLAGYYSRVNQALSWIWKVMRHSGSDTCPTHVGEDDCDGNVADCPDDAKDIHGRGATLHLATVFVCLMLVILGTHNLNVVC